MDNYNEMPKNCYIQYIYVPMAQLQLQPCLPGSGTRVSFIREALPYTSWI